MADNNTILEKLEGLVARFEEVSTLITDPAVIADQKRYVKLTKEYKELGDLMNARKEYMQVLGGIEEAKEIIANETDQEMREMAREELDACQARQPELEEQIKLLLVPADPQDGRNAILEIRGGTGGDEAAIFAGDLFRMYTKYCESKGWKMEISSANEGAAGGFKEIVCGANANAVAELVIGMLIAGSRNVAAAAQWTQGLAGDPAMAKSVEKGKKQFVGNEIKGKTLGVIGLGAIGSRVANCAIELGMEVYGYDPYISIDAAWNLSSQVRHCVNLNDMLPLCDYITIHVPYLPTTKDTINAQTLALCKDGVRLLNYARGELVNTDALLEALDTGKVSGYMTDFPTEALLGRPGVICTPHLGASTPEAEDNCAVMAAQEISDYLKNGNITHSVNMPEVHQPRAGGKRICIIHKNEPGMISQITALTTEAGLNIENMVNKSKKNMAYTMLDATGAVNDALAAKLSAIPAVVRVRIL